MNVLKDYYFEGNSYALNDKIEIKIFLKEESFALFYPQDVICQDLKFIKKKILEK